MTFDASKLKVALRIRVEQRMAPGEGQECPFCNDPVFGDMLTVFLHVKPEGSDWNVDWEQVPVCCASCLGDDFVLGFGDDDAP